MAGDSDSRRVVIDPQALIRPLPDEEAVVLNVETEIYFGLNKIGLNMWNALTTSESVDAAVQILLDSLDVNEARLRTDIEAFIVELTDRGLVLVEGSA